ncbi:Fic family protein [Paraneptunicella aestuarii]|uniref:Fic/DOC family protein n=1 Tax=Paraneptunicella aestuarii TaxID=2831148 RepID=UPI001E3A6AE2|nr:Fic family protein [Paraneptunicella aestuarii]UAA38994.1 Fic family protein [Paraneptunicella aestuarii]
MENNLPPDSVEPAFYPNSHVFVNLLDIQEPSELRQKEAAFTAIRSIELLQKPDTVEQTFDFEHLKSIHRHLFQDLYSWAGKPRSYDVAKDGDIFTPANKLAEYQSLVFERSISYYQSTDKPTIEESAQKLARCLGIINIYHPFPEGNGRTQRLFISALANVFNYMINWDLVHNWENVETFKQVHRGNYEPLEHLMLRILAQR